jgi:hypothetical protein
MPDSLLDGDNGAVGRPIGRLVAGAAALSAGAVVGTGAASLAGAAYFARKVLTPDRHRPDDVEIASVTSAEVEFVAGPETLVPGRYGVWFDAGAGHARVGEIRWTSADGTRVARDLLAVDAGELAPGPARWNPYFYWGPPPVSLGLAAEDVLIDSDVGPMPAWLLPGDGPATMGDPRPRPRGVAGGVPARGGAAAGHAAYDPHPCLSQRRGRAARPRRALQPGPVRVARYRRCFGYAVAARRRSVVMIVGWSMGGPSSCRPSTARSWPRW